MSCLSKAVVQRVVVTLSKTITGVNQLLFCVSQHQTHRTLLIRATVQDFPLWLGHNVLLHVSVVLIHVQRGRKTFMLCSLVVLSFGEPHLHYTVIQSTARSQHIRFFGGFNVEQN